MYALFQNGIPTNLLTIGYDRNKTTLKNHLDLQNSDNIQRGLYKKYVSLFIYCRQRQAKTNDKIRRFGVIMISFVRVLNFNMEIFCWYKKKCPLN